MTERTGRRRRRRRQPQRVGKRASLAAVGHELGAVGARLGRQVADGLVHGGVMWMPRALAAAAPGGGVLGGVADGEPRAWRW